MSRASPSTRPAARRSTWSRSPSGRERSPDNDSRAAPAFAAGDFGQLLRRCLRQRLSLQRDRARQAQQGLVEARVVLPQQRQQPVPQSVPPVSQRAVRGVLQWLPPQLATVGFRLRPAHRQQRTQQREALGRRSVATGHGERGSIPAEPRQPAAAQDVHQHRLHLVVRRMTDGDGAAPRSRWPPALRKA